MAGTDRSRMAEAEAPEGPVTVLVEPQMGENIGAAARAMWNFGLTRLRLVRPRDGWPNPRAVATASGASGVIDGAAVFEDTATATADLHTLYATTARPRELTKRVLTPEAAMAEAAALLREGVRVGILYGPERAGLANQDIVRATAIVSVPVNPAFASLNLAQCVLLMAYEWRRSFDATPAVELVTNRATLAEQADVARMVEHLIAALDGVAFFRPEDKRPAMTANLANLFHRLGLTDQEVRTLRGVIRALSDTRPDTSQAPPRDPRALRGGLEALERSLIQVLVRRDAHLGRAREIAAVSGVALEDVLGQTAAQSALQAEATRAGLDPDQVRRVLQALAADG